MLQLSKKQTVWAVAAGALAAACLVVRSKTKQAEAENPPTGEFITVEGVKLHYLRRGAGPVVVLLHGNGATSLDFELSGLVDMLAREHTVIAFDRPGFGYSDRPRSTVWTPAEQAALLGKALSALHVEQAVVVGHSWGTLVALAMALDNRDLVRGLVLMGGYYYPSPRLDVVMMSGPAIPVLGDVLRFTVSPLLSRLLWPGALKKIFSPRPVAESFKRWPKWLSLRPSQLRASSAESVMPPPSCITVTTRSRCPSRSSPARATRSPTPGTMPSGCTANCCTASCTRCRIPATCCTMWRRMKSCAPSARSSRAARAWTSS
jgi:pimeloyl-ACP methyl ester carboxylesterase